MRPWGGLPGYGRDWPLRTDVALRPTRVEQNAGLLVGRVTSLRLPEPMLGLRRLNVDAQWHLLNFGLWPWPDLRAAYFAARLDGLDDEQAAERAWAMWKGGGG